MAECCQDNQIEIKSYDPTQAYIKDFEINTIKKRITSLERRVTDIEYRLLNKGCGATGAADEHERLTKLDRRIEVLEQNETI